MVAHRVLIAFVKDDPTALRGIEPGAALLSVPRIVFSPAHLIEDAGPPYLSGLGQLACLVRLLRFHVGDIAAHVGRRFRIGLTQGLLHGRHVGFGPGRQ